MELDKDALQKMKKYWPDTWEKVLDHYNALEEKFMADIKTQRFEGRAKQMLLDRIKGRQMLLEFEQSTLAAIIPKNRLKDGVTYVAMEGTGNLNRHIDEARWDEKIQMFWYTRTKFGHTFEDTMHHFADVINDGLAGFTPIKTK